MYLVTCTHSNLVFCVSYLSQFSSCPFDIYYTAINRVFRYISGIHSYVLIYPYSGSVNLEDFQMPYLLIVLILVIPILVMSFNSENVQSLSTSRNNNTSPNPLPKWNTLHYPPLFDKLNGTLTPLSNSTSIFLYNYTVIINLVLTLCKIRSTTTKSSISISYITTSEAVSSTIYFSLPISLQKTTLLIL